MRNDIYCREWLKDCTDLKTENQIQSSLEMNELVERKYKISHSN